MSDAERPRGPDAADPYSRLEYRRLFAWPARMRREAPFLEAVAAAGPARSLLDLGCGTGEHALFFAERGFRVLGLDRSQAQIEAARAAHSRPDLGFVVGDLVRLGDSTSERFGTAICLGNTLVHVQEEADLEAACRGVHAALLPGGSWLVQILNYERIFQRGERLLPVNIVESDGEELVFLRVVKPLPAGRVLFLPTTLRLRPEADPPMEVASSRAVTLRAWTRPELEAALASAGFDRIDWYGDMVGGDFDAAASADLVFVAHRGGGARPAR